MLRDARVGRLATADLRGRPLVVPVCFALAGNVIYSAIDAKPKRDPSRPLRRVRNVLENPQASLAVDEYDEDWSRLWWVRLDGRGVVAEATAAVHPCTSGGSSNPSAAHRLVLR